MTLIALAFLIGVLGERNHDAGYAIGYGAGGILLAAVLVFVGRFLWRKLIGERQGYRDPGAVLLIGIVALGFAYITAVGRATDHERDIAQFGHSASDCIAAGPDPSQVPGTYRFSDTPSSDASIVETMEQALQVPHGTIRAREVIGSQFGFVLLIPGLSEGDRSDFFQGIADQAGSSGGSATMDTIDSVPVERMSFSQLGDFGGVAGTTGCWAFFAVGSGDEADGVAAQLIAAGH